MHACSPRPARATELDHLVCFGLEQFRTEKAAKPFQVTTGANPTDSQKYSLSPTKMIFCLDKNTYQSLRLIVIIIISVSVSVTVSVSVSVGQSQWLHSGRVFDARSEL